MKGLEFPPLLTGYAVAGDPYEAALSAVREVDPGAVFYGPDDTTMRAAVVLAPETALSEAVGVCFAVALGLNDAIGALAPPEVAVHFEWPGGFRVNGAVCGAMRACASTDDPKCEPDWLVIGTEVPVALGPGVEPGEMPNQTTLHAEGCGDITVPDLIETWARHMMNWLHIFLTDGFAPLHENWRGRAFKLGEAVTAPVPGTFVGLDEWGGMILKDQERTRILPLTRLLESP